MNIFVNSVVKPSGQLWQALMDHWIRFDWKLGELWFHGLSYVLSFNAAMTEDTVCVGLARVGAEDQTIRSGTLQELASSDLGGPLHSMIISGHLHPLEVDMLKLFCGPEGLMTLKMTDSSTYVSWYPRSLCLRKKLPFQCCLVFLKRKSGQAGQHESLELLEGRESTQIT